MPFQNLEALYKKAIELKSQGRSAEADTVEAEAAAILNDLQIRAAKNPEDPETTAIQLYLADREWALLGDHEQVQSRIEQALAVREKTFGPDHPLTGEALAKLAEFHYLSGRFAAADPLYRKALAIFETQPAPDATVEAKALEGFAQTLSALGRTDEADLYLSRAIERCGTDEQGKRSLYFLLMARADGLEKLKRVPEALVHRQKAAALLPRGNPGEMGFHV